MEPTFGLELTKFFAHRHSNLRAGGIEFLLCKLRRINPQEKQIISFSLAYPWQAGGTSPADSC